METITVITLREGPFLGPCEAQLSRKDPFLFFANWTNLPGSQGRAILCKTDCYTTALRTIMERKHKVILICSALQRLLLHWDWLQKLRNEKKDFKVWHPLTWTSLFIFAVSLNQVFLIILYLNSATYQIFLQSPSMDEPILSALWATSFYLWLDQNHSKVFGTDLPNMTSRAEVYWPANTSTASKMSQLFSFHFRYYIPASSTLLIPNLLCFNHFQRAKTRTMYWNPPQWVSITVWLCLTLLIWVETEDRYSRDYY